MTKNFYGVLLLLVSTNGFALPPISILSTTPAPGIDPITAGKLLWQTIKNGVTQVAQLEQLHKNVIIQAKNAERFANNFKAGKVTSAGELLREMNHIESSFEYMNNLVNYALALDDKIAKNLYALKNTLNGDHYRQLVQEQLNLRTEKKKAIQAQIKHLSSPEVKAESQAAKQRLTSLVEKNDGDISGAARQKLTTQIIAEVAMLLAKIDDVNKKVLQAILKKEANNEEDQNIKHKKELIKLFDSRAKF